MTTQRTLPQLIQTNPMIFLLGGLLMVSFVMIAVNFFLYQNVIHQRQITQDIELKIPQKISVIPLRSRETSAVNVPLSVEEIRVQTQQVAQEQQGKDSFEAVNQTRGALQNLPITTPDYTVFLALDTNRITVFFFQSDLSLDELKARFIPTITEALQQGGADISQETIDYIKLEVPAPKQS